MFSSLHQVLPSYTRYYQARSSITRLHLTPSNTLIHVMVYEDILKPWSSLKDTPLTFAVLFKDLVGSCNFQLHCDRVAVGILDQAKLNKCLVYDVIMYDLISVDITCRNIS